MTKVATIWHSWVQATSQSLTKVQRAGEALLGLDDQPLDRSTIISLFAVILALGGMAAIALMWFYEATSLKVMTAWLGLRAARWLLLLTCIVAISAGGARVLRFKFVREIRDYVVARRPRGSGHDTP